MNKFFWAGRKVLVTGHSGFKGSWLSVFLTKLGAEVIGLSNSVDESHINWKTLGSRHHIREYFCDMRDSELVAKIVKSEKPDVVFNLAAEAIVSECQRDPLKAIGVNVLGTANILNALRILDHKVTVIFVTTDKVYLSNGLGDPHVETDPLGGNEIYSASKAASEMVIQGFIKSYFDNDLCNIKIGVARAGNVLGGGDWGTDRLVPDVYRAIRSKEKYIHLRNPNGRRPWQHVFDLTWGYIRLAEVMHNSKVSQGEAWNFSNPQLDFTVSELVSAVLDFYPREFQTKISETASLIVEEKLLTISSMKAENELAFKSFFGKRDLVSSLSTWYSAYIDDPMSIWEVSSFQLNEYFERHVSK